MRSQYINIYVEKSKVFTQYIKRTGAKGTGSSFPCKIYRNLTANNTFPYIL